MVMKPVYCLGVPGSPTIEISQEELRSILTQIEAELHGSKAYRSALISLQTLLGETAASAKILLKAIGREAIRLAFLQFAQQCNDVAASNQDNATVQADALSTTQSAPQQNSDEVAREVSPSNPESTVIPTNTTSAKDTLTLPVDSTTQSTMLGVTKTKKQTKAELAAQIAAREREECLCCLGQELRQARDSQSLSLRDIHKQTLVPIHLIEALETGRVDLLPEDVYVRGFIRRIGDALGLDGASIAASLPAPDPVKTVVPSWYRPDSSPFAFHLSSVHLYLGYTTLIAGAVGGLALLSQQSTSRASSNAESFQPLPPPSSFQSGQRVESTSIPGLKSSKAGIAVGSDIAPPEALRF